MEPNLGNTAALAVGVAFLASLVEVAETFTIVLAVAAVREARPALVGAAAGMSITVTLVLALGPMLDSVPFHLLHVLIGLLLLLFGMRWLRKAILRAGRLIALHDEEQIFSNEIALLEDAIHRHRARAGWIAGLAAFNAVVLEGFEVVFVVLAIGAVQGSLVPAGFGALGAYSLVLGVGVTVPRPLSRVPENALKFVVGAVLSALGVYWTGKGLGILWPGGNAVIAAFVALFLTVALALVLLLRAGRQRTGNDCR